VVAEPTLAEDLAEGFLAKAEASSSRSSTARGASAGHREKLMGGEQVRGLDGSKAQGPREEESQPEGRQEPRRDEEIVIQRKEQEG
jgi:hypothetical protein